MDLPFTVSSAAAQRLAKIELERARQQIVVQLQCKLGAYRMQPGDTVQLTIPRYGWAEKVFEVADLTLRQDVGRGDVPLLVVELTLKETAAGVYDWNDGEETTVDLAPDTSLPGSTPRHRPRTSCCSRTRRRRSSSTTCKASRGSWSPGSRRRPRARCASTRFSSSATTRPTISG